MRRLALIAATNVEPDPQVINIDSSSDNTNNNGEDDTEPNHAQPIYQSKPCCAICFDIFDASTYIIASFCGHIYCRRCFNMCKTVNRRCGVCTRSFGAVNNQYRLRFKSIEGKFVCAFPHCPMEIVPELNFKALRCECVYCEHCIDRLTDRCICSTELGGSNKVLSLIFSFS